MSHSYGKFSSWVDAVRSFGDFLSGVQSNTPVYLWPIAMEMMSGVESWSRDLIREFEHSGAIEVGENRGRAENNTYFVRQTHLEMLLEWNT